MANVSVWQLSKFPLFCLSAVVGVMSVVWPQPLSSLVSGSTHSVSSAAQSFKRVISGPVDSVVDSGARANQAQCDSIRLSTGSTESCAAMMTPAELPAASG